MTNYKIQTKYHLHTNVQQMTTLVVRSTAYINNEPHLKHSTFSCNAILCPTYMFGLIHNLFLPTEMSNWPFLLNATLHYVLSSSLPLPDWIRLIKNEEMFKGKNVVNNVDMSSLRAPWQNGPYKNQQNNKKTRRTPSRNRHSGKKNLCVFFGFFIDCYI